MLVFYRSEMTIQDDLGSLQGSKSYYKPKLFVDLLAKKYPELQIQDFPPITDNELSAIHDSAYVKSILKGQLKNGFGNTDTNLAHSFLYTNGSIVAAAVHSCKEKQISCSPSSGFHHAKFDFAAGFCTFNGLVLAAIKCLENGANQVGILDFDYHYGDGTDHILNRIPEQFQKSIIHFSAGKKYFRPDQANAFLKDIPEILITMKSCDVIIYQAGADQHIQDPLGGFLTDDQLKYRDELVFEFCARNQIGCAWNLAGGYQEPYEKVLNIHLNTFEAALKFDHVY